MFNYVKLTSCASCSLFPETPLTLSQLCRVSLRKATGVRGLEKIAKLNIPSRLIDYLSYNWDAGMGGRSRLVAPWLLALPSPVVCLKPSVAIDRTEFPESPLTVVFHLRGLLENISKALGRPCLSFCWGRGPVLALLELCSNSGVSSIQLSSFHWPSSEGLSGKTVLGTQGKAKQGWGPGYCCWFPHVWEVQGCSAISNSFSTTQCWGAQRDCLSHRGWSCGRWGPDHVAWDGYISDILLLGCFFSGAKGGYFPRPTSTHYSGTLYGFYGGSSGSSFPTTSSVSQEIFLQF